MNDFKIPDAIEPVEGWKVLCHSPDGTLGSPRYPLTWTPGEKVVARCAYAGAHKAPNDHCSCGIYMVKSQMRAMMYDDLAPSVLVRLKGWGIVVPADRGYRVQYAYPAEMYLLDGTDDACEKLTRLWGVPTHSVPRSRACRERLTPEPFLNTRLVIQLIACFIPIVVNLAVQAWRGFSPWNTAAVIVGVISAIFVLLIEREIRKF